MKTIIALSFLSLVMLAQLRGEHNAIEEARYVSMELNEINIEIYDNRIKENHFTSKEEKQIYLRGYLGFLIWIRENEYSEYNTRMIENIRSDNADL